MRIQIDHGAKVDSKDKDGQTALALLRANRAAGLVRRTGSGMLNSSSPEIESLLKKAGAKAGK